MGDFCMSYEHILFEVADAVATVTLNRPERLNALTPTMREELHLALTRCDEDDAIRAVIVTGAGRGFCSGGDVKAMHAANQDKQRNPVDERIAPMRDKVLLAMEACRKPVIAAINGAAAGGGLGLALGADIRLAASTARMGMTFAHRGLHPDWGGTFFLPRIVGVAKACELIWSGDMIDAPTALELGIVSYVTEPDALLTTTRELAAKFAAGPPIAIRLAKRAIYKNLTAELREALEYETYAQNLCAATEDAREGIAAFVEKRSPEFKGQ